MLDQKIMLQNAQKHQQINTIFFCKIMHIYSILESFYLFLLTKNIAATTLTIQE